MSNPDSPTDQPEKEAVHVVELVAAERLVDVAELVGVDVHVVVGDEAGDELAVEEVVRGVHRAQARVRVGVADTGGRTDG